MTLTERTRCRFCDAPLRRSFVDLGMSPLCESFLKAEELDRAEAFYPLHVQVCERCFLVQLPAYVTPEHIFTEYAYFSSYSTSWLKHAETYCRMITERLGLGPDSLAVELASNDGYLLQHFPPLGVPVLGVEPAANVAKVAVEKGVPTIVDFFGRDLARKMKGDGKAADLIAGNNVLAQVPDLNDFVGGIAILLKPDGVATLEFPHLQRLMEENQFDTIYHEHFSYFSLRTTVRIAEAHGLRVFDVEELPSHGGSLRVYLCHAASSRPTDGRVSALSRREEELGFDDPATYGRFEERVRETKRKLLSFLIEAKTAGKRVVGYGAPGKGNTLLNYCGIRADFLDYVVDRNPYKHGRYTPGTHIPIFPPERIDETCPDYLLILPWNLKTEIVRQMAHVTEWGCKFVVPIPEVRIVAPSEAGS